MWAWLDDTGEFGTVNDIWPRGGEQENYGFITDGDGAGGPHTRERLEWGGTDHDSRHGCPLTSSVTVSEFL